MKTTLDSLSLLAATIMLAIIFVAGLRERIVNIPRWFANPPASFDLIRQQAVNAPKFWIPVQLLFVITLVTAFITNWSDATVRNRLLISTGFFLLVIILTATYYVREIMAFQRIPATASVTPELLKRVNRWYQTTVIRNILQGVALGFLVWALI
ncbi:hypothetical protein [Spirosoma sp.]|uniref:hypothetical protein n=1 Tax=Spirosoma sp. TaxID=1899569 RepID=UPI003B3A698E